MLEKIFPHSWMALPSTTRTRMRELLGIPKTGQTEVSTTGGSQSILVSDGVTAKDLEVITVAMLQKFTESIEVEFPRLWAMAVRKADMTLSESGKQLPVDAEKKLDAIVHKAVESVDKKIEAAVEEVAKEVVADLIVENKHEKSTGAKTKE